MLLAEMPWAARVWALPFLTVLAPSERYWEQQGRNPKPLTDWARQIVLQAQRWFPTSTLVVVADGAFASLQLLSDWAARRRPMTGITRLRLEARFIPPCTAAQERDQGPAAPGRIASPFAAKGPDSPQDGLAVVDGFQLVWRSSTSSRNRFRHRGLVSHRPAASTHPLGVGARPQRQLRNPRSALYPTQLDRDPSQILPWFLWRWQVEVTFQEVRAHLGVETQRQWSRLAIARTTPVLLGLFSVITLLAHRLACARELPIRQAAWYRKTQPTFSDAIALIREQLWHPSNFFTSHLHQHVIKIPRSLFSSLCQAARYTA